MSRNLAAGRPFPAGKGPEDFEWTEQCTPENDAFPGRAGCRCAAGSCDIGTCPCVSSGLARDEQGRLIVLQPRELAGLELTACGPACACFGACGCSFDDVGARAAVSLREQPGKGWCAFADEPLPAGLLICQVCDSVGLLTSYTCLPGACCLPDCPRIAYMSMLPSKPLSLSGLLFLPRCSMQENT